MKKLVIVVAIALTFLSSQLYAADNGVYLGIGGGYAIQNFDTSDLSRVAVSNVNFDNSLAFDTKIGYHFNKWFSTEFDFDYMPEFSWKGFYNYGGNAYPTEIKVQIMTFMIAAKFSPDFGSPVVRPYVIVGGGIMSGKVDINVSDYYVSAEESTTKTEACAKIGGGIDFYVTKNISLGIEGSYVSGFSDLDKIRYTNLSGNFSYHF